MRVSIVRNWDWPDPLRQTPCGLGKWEDFEFTCEPVDDADYVIISNYIPDQMRVNCDAGRVWRVLQEPPAAMWQPLHKGPDWSSLIFTSDSSLDGCRYLRTHAVSFWHVNKTYDELRCAPCPQKTGDLSWITSNLAWLPGHKKRMEFLDILKSQVGFDLYGRGFQPVDDKWDGLAPYRYSIAVENFRGDWYWTEKLMDCYLAWCMPIYCGCEKIDRFFPKDSFVQVNISNPTEAIRTIREVIKSDLCEKNRDAIAYARELILDKYQFFPFVVNQVKAFESREGCIKTPRLIVIENDIKPVIPKPKVSFARRVARKIKKLVVKSAEGREQ